MLYTVHIALIMKIEKRYLKSMHSPVLQVYLLGKHVEKLSHTRSSLSMAHIALSLPQAQV